MLCPACLHFRRESLSNHLTHAALFRRPHPRMQPSKPLSEEEELQRALQLSMAAAGGAALGGSSYGGSGAGTSGTGHLQDE